MLSYNKFDFEMIILDVLSRRSDYQLRVLKADLRTITFDETVEVYTRDKSLSSEAKWDNELKKYENQLQIDKNDRIYYRDDSNDNWIFYIELWARADFLNFIHKNYEYCSYEIMFDIIKVK